MIVHQWIGVISLSLKVIPISLITKLIIFKVFKLGNEENKLEESIQDEAIKERKKSQNLDRNNISRISETNKKFTNYNNYLDKLMNASILNCAEFNTHNLILK